MTLHYFAFGSNMSSARLKKRIPEAQSLGAARLPGWAFACNKTGNDGSAKANILQREDALVWGVVYALPRVALPVLDRYEGGYERIEVQVERHPQRERIIATTYVSDRIDDDLMPFDWYKRHMLRGAREHGLPDDHIRRLRALASLPSPC